MNSILGLWKRQPILVITLVEAVLGLLLAFGVNLTQEQVGSILVVIAALGGALGWSQVSPAQENRWLAPKE